MSPDLRTPRWKNKLCAARLGVLDKGSWRRRRCERRSAAHAVAVAVMPPPPSPLPAPSPSSARPSRPEPDSRPTPHGAEGFGPSGLVLAPTSKFATRRSLWRCARERASRNRHLRPRGGRAGRVGPPHEEPRITHRRRRRRRRWRRARTARSILRRERRGADLDHLRRHLHRARRARCARCSNEMPQTTEVRPARRRRLATSRRTAIGANSDVALWPRHRGTMCDVAYKALSRRSSRWASHVVAWRRALRRARRGRISTDRHRHRARNAGRAKRCWAKGPSHSPRSRCRARPDGGMAERRPRGWIADARVTRLPRREMDGVFVSRAAMAMGRTSSTRSATSPASPAAPAARRRPRPVPPQEPRADAGARGGLGRCSRRPSYFTSKF